MNALPAVAGTGFKPQHFTDLCENPLRHSFIEVHAENYLGAGGPPHAMLTHLRQSYALSVHGVGLSLGGEAPPDRCHLERLQALLSRYQPESFSEHLAWSSHAGIFHADLLPLAYDDAALDRVSAHVEATQDALNRQILIENPSVYLQFADTGVDEAQFLSALVQRTGCGLLLDINNLFVSASNHDWDVERYLAALPLYAIGEFHLAGHTAARDGFLIDTHGAAVADAVWSLYQAILGRTGPRPTLIEWDNDVPEWSVLRAQAGLAQSLLDHRTLAAVS